MMETDENLHILFAYEEKLPDHQRIYEQIPYQDDSEYPIISNDGVKAGLGTPWTEAATVTEGSPGVSDLPRLNFEVQQSYVADEPGFDTSQAERVKALLEIVKSVYVAAEPRPAFVYSLQHRIEAAHYDFALPAPIDATSLPENQINNATWISIFPPRLVETYGRQRLLAAPGWRVEELDDGAIMIVSHARPDDSDFHRKLNAYLDLDGPRPA